VAGELTTAQVGQPKVTIVEDFALEYYSDSVRVSHSDRSFALDFGRAVPWHENEVKFSARVLMSPQGFQSLLEALQENWQKYVDQYAPKR
jgi:hypothetical protein